MKQIFVENEARKTGKAYLIINLFSLRVFTADTSIYSGKRFYRYNVDKFLLLNFFLTIFNLMLSRKNKQGINGFNLIFVYMLISLLLIQV